MTITATLPATELPATTRQIATIRTMMAERGIIEKQGYNWNCLSQAGASAQIVRLKSIPRTETAPATYSYFVGPDTAPQVLVSTPVTTPAKKPVRIVLEDGFYMLEGEVYKVKHNQEGTRQYASKLSGAIGEAGRFHMAQGAIRRIRPEHRMTVEQASAFGNVYAYCACCGRKLTNDDSIALGIGPDCFKKYFG